MKFKTFHPGWVDTKPIAITYKIKYPGCTLSVTTERGARSSPDEMFCISSGVRIFLYSELMVIDELL
jgi:hypothetical protein